MMQRGRWVMRREKNQKRWLGWGAGWQREKKKGAAMSTASEGRDGPIVSTEASKAYIRIKADRRSKVAPGGVRIITTPREGQGRKAA